MRKKQYLILIIVLAAIVAAIFIARGVKSHQEKAAQEEEEASTVYAAQFDASDVAAFSYVYDTAEDETADAEDNADTEETADTEDTADTDETAGAGDAAETEDEADNRLEFSKSDDGTWIYTGDESVDIDEDSITSLLETLGTIVANYTVNDAKDISEYGLDAPTQEVNLTFSDGTTMTLTFGMENQVLGGYYLQVSDDGNIYLVDSSLVTTTLNQSVEDLTYVEEETTDTAEEDTSE